MRIKRAFAMVLVAMLMTSGFFIFQVSVVRADFVQKQIFGNVTANGTVRAWDAVQNGFSYFYIQNRTNEGNVWDIMMTTGTIDYYDPYISGEEGTPPETGFIIDWQTGDPGIIIIEREFGSYGTDHAGYIAFNMNILDSEPTQIFDNSTLHKIPIPKIDVNGSNFINLSWEPLPDPLSLVAGYKVYRSDDNGTVSGDAEWGLVGGSTSAPLTDPYYNDTTVSPDETYYYSLKLVFTGYQNNNPGSEENYQSTYFGEGSGYANTSGEPPTVDYVQIRTQPGGLGDNLCDPINYRNYPVGETDTYYGAMYNDTTGYIDDVPATATWSSDTPSIADVSTPGTSTTLTCSPINWGTVMITLDDGTGIQNTTIVTVDEPTVDYIQIRDAAGGLGNDLGDPGNYPTYWVGYTTTFYGAEYNFTAGYIGDVLAAATWVSDGPSIVDAASPGSSSIITCSDTNSGTVTIMLDDGTHQNTTQVTVSPPTVDYIQIRDEAGGTGTVLSDPLNYPSYWVGNSTTFYGASYNSTAGYLSDVPITSTWSSDDPSIVGVTTPGDSSTITCSDTNWGTVTITLDDGTYQNTTQVTVMEPTVDYIQIRSASGGGGVDLTDPANYPDYPLGYTTTFYGAEYNITAGYIGPVPASSTWSSNDTGIVLVTSPGEQSGITCDNVNYGWVWVELDDGNGHIVQTQVTVLEVVVDYIQIRDQTGGGGNDLGDPAYYPEYPVGHSTDLYAAAYNSTSGYIGDLSVDWTIPITTILTITSPGSSTNVVCSNTDWGTITLTADDLQGNVNTTQITVLEPTVDTIQIRDAPGGAGTELSDPANYPDYVLGYSTTFYGAQYNDTAGYLGPVDFSLATWDSNDTSIVNLNPITPATGDSTVVTCDNVNFGWVWVTLDDGEGHQIQARVTVLEVVIDYIQIRSAAGGGGVDLGDPVNYPSYPVGHSATFYAAAYNDTSGYVTDLSVDWTITPPTTTILTVSTPGSSTSVDCSNTDWGTVTITANDGQGNTNTTDVTVLQPTVDYVLIRDAALGAGTDLSNVANYPSYPVGHITTFYGARYNDTAGYLEDVPSTSTWDSGDPGTVTVISPGTSSIITCSDTVWGTVTITLTDGAYPTKSSTTDVTVIEPTVDYVLIRDTAGGAGLDLSDPANFPSYPVGHITTFYGAEYNNTADFIGDVPLNSTWTSQNPAIVDAGPTGSTSTITCDDTAWGLVTITLEDWLLHQAITNVTVLEPTVDYVLIRDAAGGGGNNLCDPANYPTYPVGHFTSFYGAEYNNTAGYIGDVPSTSTWDSADPNIVTVTSPASQSVITASSTTGGSSVITLEDDDSGHQNTTTVTVLDPTVDYIMIVDAAGGAGNWVGYMTYAISETDTFYLAGFNNTADYIGDLNADPWFSDNTSVGSLSPTTGSSSTTFTAQDVSADSTCQVTAYYDSLTNLTGILTVLGPKVDYIQIRDAPDNGGAVVTTATYIVWEIDNFYAAAYNHTEGYLDDVEVTWESNAITVGQVTPLGLWTNFTAQNVATDSTCIITATYIIGITNQTGLLTVLAPRIDEIMIRDGADGGGDIVLTRTYDASETDTFYAAGYNQTVGYVEDVDVTWSSDNTGVGTVTPGPGSSTTFTAEDVTVDGTCKISADYPTDISNSTGVITVIATVDTEGPAQPAQPILNVKGTDEIGMTWEANTEPDLDHYIIQRSTDPDGEWTNITTVDKSVTSYTDTGLKAGKKYYYQIVAVDESGNQSPPSPWAGATTDSEDEFPWVLLLLPLIIAIVVILLLWLLLRRRKKEEEELPPEEAPPEEAPEAAPPTEEFAEEELPEEEFVEEELPEEEIPEDEYEEYEEFVDEDEFEEEPETGGETPPSPPPPPPPP
ncbi:MAG: fibronectin type III domain-containing protein [Thermoplasmata archaeon]|nr:MAG: fibronectin type III domain-containing protein [Thermoplasmata archaeon]